MTHYLSAKPACLLLYSSYFFNGKWRGLSDVDLNRIIHENSEFKFPISSSHLLVVVRFFVCRTQNCKPTKSRVGMMPIGTPKVPYRVPGEGTWQWVDLWNALVSNLN